MSKLKKVAGLTFGNGVNILVNFLFLPYMARVLDYEEYGTYGQVILIVSFVIAVTSFGLSQIIYVYLNDSSKSKGNVLFNNLVACGIVGSLGTVVIFFSSPVIADWLGSQKLELLLKIYSLSILISVINLSINSFLIYSDRVKSSVTISISTNLIKVALVVFAIQVYASIKLALLAIVLSYIFQFIVGFFKIRKSVAYDFNNKLVVQQLKSGFPLALSGILGSGILYMDGIMVSKIKGVTAFAIYRNGAIEVPFIATIYASIAAIILPEVAKLFSEKKFSQIVLLKKEVIMNSMMLTYPVLVFLLFNAQDIIVLYLGEKYSQSAIIFAIYNLTLLMRISTYNDILVAANKGRVLLLYYLFVFILNFVLNYFMIKSFGIVGAAMSTVISLLIFAYLLLRKSLTYLNSSFIKLFDLKKTALLLVLCISWAFSLTLILDTIETQLIRLILFATGYFPLIYFILIRKDFFSNQIKSKIFKILRFID